MEPYDTVRRYAELWAANDITGLLAAYHEDFVLHYFGTSPLAGDHVGKDAAIRVLLEATQRSGRLLDEIEDVLTGATFGAIVARESVGRDGETRLVRRVLVYTVSNGKLRECWLYDEDQRAIDELWSAPSPTPSQH
ncbi:MAG: nuclear transport factor 2 family protein [Actinomycetota bacterium]|nr:nuclear transport factor 2 family protein [Actinomycetota bacterium]